MRANDRRLQRLEGQLGRPPRAPETLTGDAVAVCNGLDDAALASLDAALEREGMTGVGRVWRVPRAGGVTSSTIRPESGAVPVFTFEDTAPTADQLQRLKKSLADAPALLALASALEPGDKDDRYLFHFGPAVVMSSLTSKLTYNHTTKQHEK